MKVELHKQMHEHTRDGHIVQWQLSLTLQSSGRWLLAEQELVFTA